MISEIKLGDIVSKLTNILGIPHCSKCEERRLILNKIKKIGLIETTRRMMAVSKNPKIETQDLKDAIIKLTDCCKK